MRCFFSSLFFLLVFSTAYKSTAQNKIYTATAVKPGKVVELTPAFVTYTAPNSKKKLKLPTASVLLLFNEKGAFLTPSRMDYNLDNTWQQVQQFINGIQPALETDRVFTTDRKIVQGNITAETTDALAISINKSTSSISKKMIAAVVYRDGHHLILGPVQPAVEMLLTASAGTGEKGAGQTALAGPPKKPADTPVSGAAGQEKAAATTIVDAGNAVQSPATVLKVEEIVPNIDKEAFQKKALEKTTQLTFYLKVLYTKTSSTEEKNKAIEQALTLFVNESAIVQVSNVVTNAIKEYLIKNYLSHIKLVPYDKIDIEWNKVEYASDLKLGMDGNYYGTVSFEQVFKGYLDGQVVYKDVTRKDVTVVLKSLEKNVNGRPVNTWDVLLSDIGVKSTKTVN